MTAATAVTARRGRPRDESIDAAVLDAAIDQLVDRGLAGLSMEAVATSAGVAKTTVYRRWPNTDELALAALGRIKGEAVEPPPGSVRDQLVYILDRLLASWGDDRFAAVMRRVAADGNTRPEHFREARDRLVGPHIEIMQRVLRRGVDEGLIGPDVDLEWIREAIVSPILARRLTLRSMPSREQVIGGLDLVLRGVAP